jgi:hypothetical protein
MDFFYISIGLYHPLDGVTIPKYKLLCFLSFLITEFFCKEEKALAFNRDRCCHLVLSLQLILFHCVQFFIFIQTQILFNEWTLPQQKPKFCLMNENCRSNGYRNCLLLKSMKPNEILWFDRKKIYLFFFSSAAFRTSDIF